MKIRKQILKGAVAAAVGVSCLFGAASCGGGNTESTNSNSKTDLEIRYWQSGYGVEYMNKIIADFKTKYPQYNVMFTPEPLQQVVSQTMEAGKDDTVDIYLNSLDNLIKYEDMFEPLNDVYETTVEGESKKIGDKFQDLVKDGYKREDGNYYCMSYAGSPVGIMYNADIIDGVNYTVPNTSDELRNLSVELSNVTGETWTKAWVHFQDGSVGYYNALLKTWQAQYSGIDYYKNNWLTLTDEDGNSPSKAAYTSETDGRKQALYALGNCVNPSTVLTGSNTKKFTEMQTFFIAGKAAMMVNGPWIQNEMKQSGGKNFNCRLMKTPVISSIIDVLPDKSVKDDAELSALITAIDAYQDGEAEVALTGNGYSVTQSDWDRVAEARKYNFHNGVDHAAVINKYSTAKEAAKDFLRYYFSDEGMATFANIVHQTPSATILDESKVKIDSEWTDFEKETFNGSTKNLIMINDGGITRSAVFRSNGLSAYANLAIVSSISASDASVLKTPEALWNEMISKTDKNWKNWLANAGISI